MGAWLRPYFHLPLLMLWCAGAWRGSRGWTGCGWLGPALCFGGHVSESVGVRGAIRGHALGPQVTGARTRAQGRHAVLRARCAAVHQAGGRGERATPAPPQIAGNSVCVLVLEGEVDRFGVLCDCGFALYSRRLSRLGAGLLWCNSSVACWLWACVQHG